MCGRYARSPKLTTRAIAEAIRPLTLLPAADPPTAYNVSPTQPGYVIRPSGGDYELAEMRWGLLPAWARDARIQYSTINARVETVATKPAFRAAWKSRRCVIPASGYYEWPVIDGQKRPHYIYPDSDSMLLFAGLWEPGRDDRPDTYTIITTDADASIRSVHDRMPLMLHAEAVAGWINGSADDAALIALSAAPISLAYHQVGPEVGNVRNQGPGLIDPRQ